VTPEELPSRSRLGLDSLCCCLRALRLVLPLMSSSSSSLVVSLSDCTTSMWREVSVVGCAAQSWGTTETLLSTSGAEVGRVGEGPV
jgi:hypothetical protein